MEAFYLPIAFFFTFIILLKEILDLTGSPVSKIPSISKCV